jgi:polyhydroxyalkanoate synthesis regulator phasin
MEHSKIISSAAYLKIYVSQKNIQIFGEIILAGNKQGRVFYNKDNGNEIINQYLKDGKITEEEFKHLYNELKESSLIKNGCPENDLYFEMIKDMAEIIKPLANTENAKNLIEMARFIDKITSDNRDGLLLCLIEREINQSINTNHETIN